MRSKIGLWTDRMQIGSTIGARIPAFGSKTGFEPRQQNKKMLNSRGKSQDVVENKGQKNRAARKPEMLLKTNELRV